MAMKIFLKETICFENTQFIGCGENVTHVTPRVGKMNFQRSFSVPIGLLC